MPPQSWELGAMFLLGILGSGHCVGMCGPLVVAFPAACRGMLPHVFYHIGRVAAYTCIGAFLGGVGGILASLGRDPLLWTSRLQLLCAFVAGGFLLLFGLMRIRLIREPAWLYPDSLDCIPGLRGVVAADITRKGPTAMLRIGLFLGLLPCGLSYAAFGRALASGGFVEGGAMVLAFGLGTVPALLAVGLGAGRLLQRYRAYSDPIAGMIMMAMAAHLLLDVAVSV
ncbi:MAG: sulfite exporter TauE/SafE family protein [Desulfobacteraceae bacterium]|nr:sulfite exporter TauE/SafE family protein [Desulfobacteraceae bacterium]